MKLLGVDIGGTSIKTGVVDGDGKILCQSAIKTENVTASLQIKKVAEQIKTLLKTNGLTLNEIKAIGVGCPGAIDGGRGIVKYSSNLKWQDFELKKTLEELLKKPVRVANDADCATLGEVVFGCAKDYDTVVMLTLGTGVGGGIVVNKKLYEGPNGMASELGHIVLKKNGLPCGCGRSGCLEQYASASALIRQTQLAMQKNPASIMWKHVKNDLSKVDGKTAFICEKLGDKSAKRVVSKYIEYLSEGILDYCNIFRPDAIILGGGIANEGNNLTDRVTAYLEKYEYGYKRTPKSKVLNASLKNGAGIIGSASLVKEF